MDEEVLYKLYIEERKSRRTVAKELGVSEGTVKHYLEKYGFSKKKLGVKPKYDVEHKGVTRLLANRDWLYEEYLVKRKSAQQIADELGVKYGRVDRWIAKHGFYGKKTYLNSCDETKFNYKNPIFCYYAGYVATDGYVDKNTPRVSIRSNDVCAKGLFENLANYFKFTGEVRQYGKSYDLTISSPKLIQELYNHFKITPAKTKTLEFPDSFYNEVCERMFCRGLVDGDGNIKNNGDFRFYCGSEAFIDRFIDFLNKKFNWCINKTYVRKIYPGFTLTKSKAKLFLNWCYCGYNSFLLSRKYEKFLLVCA
ncbi:hypothetical protein E308F_30410 [Moorella sp. E308F]|uniref:hypothetical protein n=1 Tax=Moorella sp. E308F TaxID=2572682 RepID=UPI0010FFBDB2|nr:hypothetical protein [Moorella sp. E308F]GEA16795.1 hypothetical protein E308F_30410 [Moorella sp. E308F]